MELELAPFIVGCAAVIGGLLITYRGSELLRKIQASRTWPSTTAKITTMEMIEFRGGKPRSYSLHLEYEYEVVGERHTGSRASFFPVSTKETIEAFMAAQESGATAYYNPSKPSEAILAREGIKRFHTLSMGVMVVVTGGILIWVSTL